MRFIKYLKNKVRYLSQKILPLDPNFITGFTDGEGSFLLSILKNSERRVGWSVIVRFEITLHLREEELLRRIREHFKGAGNILIGNFKIIYRVSDLEQILTLIIPHFLKYPLKTKKRVDFELFAKSAQLISKKEHLTEEGG